MASWVGASYGDALIVLEVAKSDPINDRFIGAEDDDDLVGTGPPIRLLEVKACFTLDLKHVRFVVRQFSDLCQELQDEVFFGFEQEDRAKFEKEKLPGESLDFIYQYGLN